MYRIKNITLAIACKYDNDYTEVKLKGKEC